MMKYNIKKVYWSTGENGWGVSSPENVPQPILTQAQKVYAHKNIM